MKGIRIVIAGDFLPYGDNIPLFKNGESETLFGEEVYSLFKSADFSIANLEGPLTDSGVPFTKGGSCIKAPAATISGIRNLGLSAVALANEHITDFMQKGVDDTLQTLQDAGIQHVGISSEAHPSPADRYLSLDLSGWKICIYNVADTFSDRPADHQLGVHVYDESLVLNEIKELKQRHDYLIVIYHGGTEYFQYPDAQTRTRFHRMADCGADFITAPHSHCIGCEEWYNGAYLLYGQGNFLFPPQKKYHALTTQGLITRLLISDKGLIVDNHLVISYYNKLYYDTVQNLADFKERSSRLNDGQFIQEQYKKLKDDEATQAEGCNPIQRIAKWLFR